MNTQAVAVEIEAEEVAAEVQSLSDLDLELVGGGAVIVSLD